MKKIIIVMALLLIIGVSVAGISEVIGTAPILNDKIIPDEDFQELKIILEKGEVEITDEGGLNITWIETNCEETICEYKLYKKNLFAGTTIKVNYDFGDSAEQKQVKLDQAIQDKLISVKKVWGERQNTETGIDSQTGATNFKTDKKVKK